MSRRLLPLLLLAGCAHVPPPVVPVAAPCPPPPALALPYLPIRDLTPQDPPDVVLRAYAVTVERLKGALRERDALLAGYRQPAAARP